ncbi:MAG: N-methylhydantoinase, partial [Baekduia sp.]|nr:N-methylhydantoinase [Baekduia sp.]
ANELRVGELLDQHLPGVPYTLSHRLNPTLREYRRASSCCIDASLKPLMSGYLVSLERRLAAAGFTGRVMMVTSNGGVLDAADVAGAPIHLINSGPAMAPVAGRFYAARAGGHGAAIVADAGGTTFDVTLVRDGRIPRTRETWIGRVHQGHITGFPSVDVTSVGSGGGSIAWVDEGGLLKVGPRSAGAQPGPACYGRGGVEPTLTDACAVLGYLDPERFLGGSMRLDLEAARDAIERGVAEPLGMRADEAAAGILRVTTEDMVHAIEQITVNQGIDPRETVLIGGGGAAGLNLVAIARRLGCAEVLIPETGAALSAAGALISDLSYEQARTYPTSTESFDFAGVGGVLAELTERCEDFATKTAPEAPRELTYSMEARYPRQNWEIEVAIERSWAEAGSVEALADAFHKAHEQLFAIAEPGSAIEILTWRVQVRARTRGIATHRVVAQAPLGGPARHRRVYHPDAGWVDSALADFDVLLDEAVLEGPAIIHSSFTTVVLDAGARGRRLADRTLHIDLSGAS